MLRVKVWEKPPKHNPVTHRQTTVFVLFFCTFLGDVLFQNENLKPITTIIFNLTEKYRRERSSDTFTAE